MSRPFHHFPREHRHSTNTKPNEMKKEKKKKKKKRKGQRCFRTKRNESNRKRYLGKDLKETIKDDEMKKGFISLLIDALDRIPRSNRCSFFLSFSILRTDERREQQINSETKKIELLHFLRLLIHRSYLT